VEGLKSFIKDYEAKVIPLSKEKVASYVNASITGLDSDYERAARAQLELETFHSDTAAFKKVKSFRQSTMVSDPSLRRQLEIMYLSYLGKQINKKTLEELINRQSVIEQKFNTYRVNVAGRELTDNQVDSILINSNNSSDLEGVWRASKRIGNEIAAGIIELAKLRNQAARSLGFTNFYEMKMKLREQNPIEIVTLFDQLDSLTRGDFESVKAEIDSALAQRYKIEES
jgi:peptidyl-dipeptidase A